METSGEEWAEATAEEQEIDRKESEAAEAKPGQLELRPQMLQVMKAMSEYGYLTMAEIQFVYGNKTWSYRHMKLLREQGVISDFDTLMSPRTAHYLTARGYRVLGKAGQLNTGWRFRPERYTTFSFRHRMACAKAGLVLERHALVHDFQPEIRLWKYQKRPAEKICDGEFWYRVPGRERMDRVGLEVELTLKNRDKQEEAFRQFSRRKLAQVWWLCGDETIIRALRRQVMDRRRQLDGQRHYFVLLEDFLAAKGKVELMDADGALFSIDADKPTLPTCTPEKPPEPDPLPPKPAVTETHAPKDIPGTSQIEPISEPRPLPPAKKPSSLARDIALFRAEASKLTNWTWPCPQASWSMITGCVLIAIVLPIVLPQFCGVMQRASAPYASRPHATSKAAKKPAPVYEYDLEDVWVSTNGFSVQNARLFTSGGRHRLGFDFCSNLVDSDVHAIALRDSRGRALRVVAQRPIVFAQRCAPASVSFGGALDLAGFSLSVEANRWDAPSRRETLEVPIKLRGR